MSNFHRAVGIVLSSLLWLGISAVRLSAQSVSFAPAANYAAGTQPYSVAAGDFNGDGKLDLAVANNTSNNVSILLGNGDGTFQAAANYAAGSQPASVAVGDFNGDGKLDLAVANNISNNVSVLLGNGNGTFQTAVNYGAGSQPKSVAVGDFNGDGKLDLAVANNISNNVSVLLGNGNGTFQTAVNYGAGSQPKSVVVGDFNNDGKLDLAVANNISNNVSVLLGNGNGTFQTAVNRGAGSQPISATVGDLNGDGKLDLAVANNTGNNVSVLMNTTPPEATSTTVTSSLNPAPQGTSVTFTATVAGTSGTPTGTVQFMDGSAALSSAVALSAGQATYTTSSLTVGTHSIHAAYSGDANFGASDSAPAPAAVGTYPSSVVMGDFNHDGIPDMAVTNFNGANLSVLLGNGDGTFQPAVNYAAGSLPEFLAAADLNNDGNLDLAVADQGGGVSVLLGNGDGTFQAAVNYSTVTAMANLAVGDFNRDGKPDLAVAEYNGSVGILLGNGDGSFQTVVNYTAGTSPQSIAVGDFNRDGKPDLAVANYLGDNVSILLGNGDGSFQSPANYAVGTNPFSIAAGDFNHDGKIDLAVANQGNGSASVLLGNGDGTFQAATGYTAGSSPYSVALGDFNHDGQLDLAVANSGSNNTSILLGNGDGTFQSSVNFAAGSAPVFVAAGDVNNDGLTDLAVVNEYDNNVSLLMGSGTGSFSEPLTETITGAPLVSLSAAPTFPVEPVGQTSPAQTVTLTNTGAVDLVITAVSISGDFAIDSNTCVTTITAGGNCTVGITFSPSAAGTRTGTLTFADTAADSPQSLALTGTGTITTVSVSPTTLTFGQQVVGTKSTDQMVTVTNTGSTTDLAFSSISISGDFLIDSTGTTCTASGTVAPGGSCQVAVAFAPTAAGALSGTLTFTNNASPTTQTVALNGTSSAISISPASLTFGSTVVGTTSNAQTVTVTNTGAAGISFSGFTATGDFAVDAASTTCSTATALAASANCTVGVTFTPTTTGARTGGLTIDSNAGSGTIPLSGTGTAPGVTLNPSSLSFGSTGLGTTSSPQSVTLTDSGTSNLTITAIAASGDFAIDATGTTCTTGTAMTPSASCTISVTFTPTAGGTRSGAVTITDDAPGSPQTVALSGAGADFSMTPRTTSLIVASGGYSSFDLLFTPQGGFNQAIDVSCSNAPKGATCTPDPASLTLDGINPTAIKLKVTTTGNAMVAPGPGNITPPSGSLPIGVWLGIFGLLGLIVMAKVSRQGGRARRLAPFAALALLVTLWAACGGGGSSTSNSNASNITPAGTYTMTVTATSGNLTHTCQVTLKVE
jgi:hypothetical protein